MAAYAAIPAVIATALSGIFGGTKVITKPCPEQAKQLQRMKLELEDVSKGRKADQEQLKRIEAENKKLAQIADAHRELVEKNTKEQNERNDPARLRENEEKLVDNFVRAVRENAPAPRDIGSSGFVNVGFIGKTSTGKSYTVNALLQHKRKSDKWLPTGLGPTTKEPKHIADVPVEGSARKLRIFDLPGDDTNFSYDDLGVIQFVARQDLLVVMYAGTITDSFRMTRVALALGKNLIFVRNQLDNAEEGESWEELLESDRKCLSEKLSLSLPEVVVFGISAKNAVTAHEQAEQELNGQSAAERCPVYQWNSFKRTLHQLGRDV